MRKHHFIVILFALLVPLSIVANDASAQIYSKADLQAEATRLRNAVYRMYSIGIKPSMSAEEVRSVGDFKFEFPFPEEDTKDILAFSSKTDGSAVIMPIMSLVALEELATAYAWLQVNGYSQSTIDLYFAMLRYRDPGAFPGGKHPTILKALGVPKDAYKTSKKVNDLSLSLRNEALAFIIIHELGHIRFKHKPTFLITKEQARADESEADRFALDVLGRTGTPVLGPMLYFQAQAYQMLHRYQFETEDAWQEHVKTKQTHPLSVERIKQMVAYTEGPLIRARPSEAATWQFIAKGFEQVILPVLEDIDLGRCIERIAKTADPQILKPRRGVEADEMMKRCRGV